MMPAAVEPDNLAIGRVRFVALMGILLLFAAAPACMSAPAATTSQAPPPPEDPAAFLEQQLDRHRAALKETPDSFEHQFAIARLLHLKGARGDEEAAESALQRFERLHEAHPGRPVVTAYLGAATVMAAQRQFFPWDKMAKLKAGRKLLDEAVAEADDPLHARVLRGVSAAHLPANLNQRDKAIADLQWALDEGAKRRDASRQTATVLAAAHFHLGRVRAQQEQMDAAREHWRQAVKLAPDAYAGLRAEAALAGGDRAP